MLFREKHSRLSKSAEEAVELLLPGYEDNDQSSLCSWADRVKFRYRWSSTLHYIDTPDSLCNCQYDSSQYYGHLVY
ncbi:S1/P1 nuclease [Dillenia turbinata]|uniref:Aspergillus nuclease S1 n=1 Tax=Dillenia turbinata TaxID=194707 RepID=A0AAN8VGY8_9MAGN